MERNLILNTTLDLLEIRLMKLSYGEYTSAIVMPLMKDVPWQLYN